jgi:hypothetical protein
MLPSLSILGTTSKELGSPRYLQIELDELQKGLSPSPKGLLLISIPEPEGLAITRKHNTSRAESVDVIEGRWEQKWPLSSRRGLRRKCATLRVF